MADDEDEQALQRIADGISARIQRIGRRDRLTIEWRRTVADTGPDPATEDRP
jgi:hypothetical protein